VVPTRLGVAIDRRSLMSPRRVFLAVGVAVLALALGAVAVGANPFATASNPERIDIISRATAINNFVDVGPVGPTPGDIYVFVDDVRFAKDPDAVVGDALGRCTLIDPVPPPRPSRFGCSITTSLPDGRIMTDGTLLNAPNAISTGAITGGTGKYRNARGEAVLDLGPEEGPHKATFRLILQP
jgi:hypothetical protein